MPIKATIDLSGANVALNELNAAVTDLERRTALSKAVKATAGEVQKVAKKIVPQPGYRNVLTASGHRYSDKPRSELKPLRETIGIRIVEYTRALVATVQPRWPAGAHGHNVEYGHRMVTRDGRELFQTEARYYMSRAIEATEGRQQRIFEGMMQIEIQRLFA